MSSTDPKPIGILANSDPTSFTVFPFGQDFSPQAYGFDSSPANESAGLFPKFFQKVRDTFVGGGGSGGNAVSNGSSSQQAPFQIKEAGYGRAEGSNEVNVANGSKPIGQEGGFGKVRNEGRVHLDPGNAGSRTGDLGVEGSGGTGAGVDRKSRKSSEVVPVGAAISSRSARRSPELVRTRPPSSKSSNTSSSTNKPAAGVGHKRKTSNPRSDSLPFPSSSSSSTNLNSHENSKGRDKKDPLHPGNGRSTYRDGVRPFTLSTTVAPTLQFDNASSDMSPSISTNNIGGGANGLSNGQVGNGGVGINAPLAYAHGVHRNHSTSSRNYHPHHSHSHSHHQSISLPPLQPFQNPSANSSLLDLRSPTTTTTQNPYYHPNLAPSPSSQSLSTLNNDSLNNSIGYRFSDIPGFPLSRDTLNDDARSIMSVSISGRSDFGGGLGDREPPRQDPKDVLRKIRGEGLSKDYWMADESAKECYDCGTVFTAFRRKHHCRICGQIFCGRCASNIIPGSRFGHNGVIRVCKFCLRQIREDEFSDEETDATTDSAAANQNHSSPSNYGFGGFAFGYSSPFLGGGRRGSGSASVNGVQGTQGAPDPAETPTVMKTPRSEFAASNMLHRSDYINHLPYTQMGVGSRWDEWGYGATPTIEGGYSAFSSRPATPSEVDGGDMLPMSLGPVSASGVYAHSRLGEPLFLADGNGKGGGIRPDGKGGEDGRRDSVMNATSAPFRRSLAEDEKVPSPTGNGNDLHAFVDMSLTDGIKGGIRSRTSSDETVPRTLTDQPAISIAEAPEDESEPQMPDSSQAGELARSPSSVSDSPLNRPESPGSRLRTGASSRMSHAVGALNHSFDESDPSQAYRYMSNPMLLRARKDSLLMPTESDMPQIARSHVERLLMQCLEYHGVPNAEAWKDPLLDILLKVAKYPRPNILRGDLPDVRNYVKIKKVAGGRPKDCEYVDGVVCTKNVLHKRMANGIHNPRIMLLTFPLEYQRVENHFTSLEPVLKQEREYLRNLVARVDAHRPHIVLAEKNISRLAIEFLQEKKITAARNVKPSVIQAVARCTQAEVISSIDRLALEPRLGRCGNFATQTFVHSLIPGRKKTLMRFAGCSRDLGGTILLRGGSIEVLRHVKDILYTMILVVYNLKLETFFLRTEGAAIDSTTDFFFQDNPAFRLNLRGADDTTRPPTPSRVLSDRISDALVPYSSVILSGSPTVRFPAPHPLVRMRDTDELLASLKRRRREEELSREPQRGHAPDASTATIVASRSTETLDQDPPTPRAASLAGSMIELRDEPTADDEPGKGGQGVLVSQDDIALSCVCSETELRHAEQMKGWEIYSAHQDRDRFDPKLHQSIVVLHSSHCSADNKGYCEPPSLREIKYYGTGDLTLGQFVDGTIKNRAKICAADKCHQAIFAHCTHYVHGSVRVQIITEQTVPGPLPADKKNGPPQPIRMFTYCKVCKRGSQPVPMSEETYHYSFGKFLELSFYPANINNFTSGCDHNMHLDHVRYFLYDDFSIRIHVDPIAIYDIDPPALRIPIKASTQLRLRNEEYEGIVGRNAAYWDSVIARIRAFNFDLVQPDKLETSRLAMADFAKKAEADRQYIQEALNKAYGQADGTNGISLNSIRRVLTMKAIEWDNEFAGFEQKYILTEKDVRRLASLHLKRLFSDSSVPTSPEKLAPPLAPPFELDEKQASIGEAALKLDDHSDIAMSISVDPSHTLHGDHSPGAIEGDLPIVSYPRLPEKASPPHSETPSTPTNLSRPDSPSNDDSDSTVCAEDSAASGPQRVAHGAQSELESSGMDSDRGYSTQVHKFPPSSGIADLVRRFDAPEETDEAEQPKMAAEPSSNTATTRPTLKRGKSDKTEYQRLSKPGPTPRPDVLSEGEVSNAPSEDSKQPMKRPADRPTRIPSRTPSNVRRQSDTPSVRNAPPSIKLTKAVTNPSLKSRPPMPRNASTTGARETKKTGNNEDAAESTVGKANKGKATFRGSPMEKHAAVYLGPGRQSPNKRATSMSSVRGSRVLELSKHFDNLSTEADRKRFGFSRYRRARPIAVARPTVEVFDNVRDAVKEESDEEEVKSSDEADDEFEDDDRPSGDKSRRKPGRDRMSSEASKDSYVDDNSSAPIPKAYKESAAQNSSVSDSVRSEETATPSSAKQPFVPPSPSISESVFRGGQYSDVEVGSVGTERSSILRTLSSLWESRGAEFLPLDFPLAPTDHLFADNPVLIREDEPSSIIALTLGSKDYKEKLRDVAPLQRLATERSETFMPEEYGHGVDRRSTWDIVDYQEAAEFQETLQKPAARHFRFQYEDGPFRCSVKIFYAEQFEALRRNCGIDEQFVDSLARCVKWNSSGGKSGSGFMKSKDDRFIIKEISRLEMDALLKFAPSYFQYMSNAFTASRPTCLAKILGFFRLTSRNPNTGKNMQRLDVVVMENLFYGRKIVKKYDLKGSVRNRHVQATGRTDEVLLDENLRQIATSSPLFIREASKKLLRTALHNDTIFLSTLNVMDYSLVVGIDQENQELVVGMIDFIRTYTWDKKLENWVKESAFLGGNGKEPTIVSPEQYKNRFREAMEGYFLMVPDVWIDRSNLHPKRKTAKKGEKQEEQAEGPSNPPADRL